MTTKHKEEDADEHRVRLDKWLWAARFFKTRNLAIHAINGGKVHYNGQRVKPSREVHLGDSVAVRTHVLRTVLVQGLSLQRRGTPEAALLYEETPESIGKREKESELRQQVAVIRDPRTGRPTKRDRRLIHRFTDVPEE